MAIYPNKVGMKSHLSRPEFTAQETQLIQQLRQQPEMLTRLQSILDLAHAAPGPLKTADEIEVLLIQELRQLGSTTSLCASSLLLKVTMLCSRCATKVLVFRMRT